MNVLIVVTSWPSADLMQVMRKIRDRKRNQIHIVTDEETSVGDPFAKLDVKPDVPGCGWLPFGVVELDAVSYLAKKEIEAVVMHPASTEKLRGLEKVFHDASHARKIPLFVLPELLSLHSCNTVADMICTPSER